MSEIARIARLSGSASLALDGVAYVECHILHGVHWETETSGFWILPVSSPLQWLFYLLLFLVSNGPLCIRPLCHWRRHNSEAKQRRYFRTQQELPEPALWRVIFLVHVEGWTRTLTLVWSTACEGWKGPCRDQRPVSAQKPRTEGKRQSSLHYERSICCWRDRNMPLMAENQPRVYSVCFIIQDTRVPGSFCVLNWGTYSLEGAAYSISILLLIN